MAFKQFSLIFFFLINLFFSAFSKVLPPNQHAMYWSVIPSYSIQDTLESQLVKANPAETVAKLKELNNTLNLYEQLRSVDNPPLIFPVAAGVYTDSLPSDSLSAYEQLIFLYRNLCDRTAEAKAIHSYGIHHAVNGNFDEAINSLNEALAINIALKNSEGMIKSYRNLALMHTFRGAHDEAIKSSNVLIDLSTKYRDNASLAVAYMSLIQTWINQNNFEAAENMLLKKALPLIYYKLNDKVGAIKCYDQLAFLYQKQKRFAEAKWFYIQSNILARKIDYPLGIVNSLISLSHVKLSIGDWQLALNDIKEAEAISEKNQYKIQLIEIKKELNELYTRIGNSNEANLALVQFTELQQELLPSLKNL